jgi:hypothetical protein
MRITNFDEANQFVKRTYTEGWTAGRVNKLPLEGGLK